MHTLVSCMHTLGILQDRLAQQHLLGERLALGAQSHPFICELHGTYKNGQALYLVLELCDGPDMYAVLQEHGAIGYDTCALYAQS